MEVLFGFNDRQRDIERPRGDGLHRPVGYSGATSMKCRYCGTEIAEKALICYRCGHATSGPRVKPPEEGSLFDRPRRRRGPVATVITILLLALIVLWFLTRQG